MAKINTTKLLAATQNFMSDKKMSQNQLADKLGCSSSIVSQILNNQYTGDAQYYLRLLANLIGYEDESKWKYVRTQNVERIKDLCLEAQESARMVAVTGNTGMSKTTTLKRIVNRDKNAYYVLCDVNMKKKDFINAILKELGLDEGGNVSEKMDAIAKHLISNPNSYLVLDDVGKFELGCKANFFQIQLLFDKTKGSCGIVLSGVPTFKKHMQKMHDKDAVGYRELMRRISYWMPLAGVEMEFIQTIAPEYQITDVKAFNYIKNKCKNYGDVENLLEAYDRAASKMTGAIDVIGLLETIHVN